jgi:hypothetical protein
MSSTGRFSSRQSEKWIFLPSSAILPICGVSDTLLTDGKYLHIVLPMDRFQLLHKIDAFQKRHKISDYALGRAAARDGHIIRRLRANVITDPRMSTVKKILDAMEAMDRELTK